MRTTILIAFVLTFLLASNETLFGQKFTLSKTRDLSFGDIAVVGTGTVEIPPLQYITDSDIVISGSHILMPSQLPRSSAEFLITYDGSSGGGQHITGILIPTSVILSGSSGNSITITNITTGPSDLLNHGFNPGGKKTKSFFVGGTLNIGSNAVGDFYSGYFTLTVTYN